ncbi:MAG: YcnI family protein [Pseudolabrys sp.]|nr:YcnI family protein [Pseudolabrys sp.]
MLLLCLAIVPASAHVTAGPNEAVAGNYFQTAFNVPHGCDGSATIAVRIKIPDGVISVKPQMKPGWDVTIKTKTLEKPVDAGHGRTINETVEEVSWRGGPLPDNLYDNFGLVMKLPDTPGQNLYFPTVQECQNGVHRWIEIPAGDQKWGDLSQPAPFIRLKAKSP